MTETPAPPVPAASPARAVLSITEQPEGGFTLACSRCPDTGQVTWADGQLVDTALDYRALLRWAAAHEDGHAPAAGFRTEIHKGLHPDEVGILSVKHGLGAVKSVIVVNPLGQQYPQRFVDYGDGEVEVVGVPPSALGEDGRPVGWEVWVVGAEPEQ